MGDRNDPSVVVAYSKFFVRRMEAVVRQSKTHEDAGNAEMLGELSHDGNRAAGANEYGLGVQHFAEGFRGNVDGGMISVHANRGTRAQYAKIGSNASRRILLYP